MKLQIIPLNTVIASYLVRYPYFKDALTFYQLYDLGIGGSGNKLTSQSKRLGKYGVYSASYEPFKIRKGGKVTTFNLRLSGSLYDSYKFRVSEKQIITIANTIKGSNNLFKKYQDAFEPAKITLNTIIKGDNNRVKIGLTEHCIKTLLETFKTD